MFAYLLQNGSVSVVDARPGMQCWTAEEAAPIPTCNSVEIRNVYELEGWYAREARRLIRHYHREYCICYERDTYKYGFHSSSMPYREEGFMVRQMEYATHVSQDAFRYRIRQEELHREWESRLRRKAESAFTSLPPSQMAECQSLTVVQKARELFLAKDEKLLRKSGLKDPNGNWTNDSIRVFVEMLLEDPKNKAKLLDLAKELTRKKKKDEDEE